MFENYISMTVAIVVFVPTVAQSQRKAAVQCTLFARYNVHIFSTPGVGLGQIDRNFYHMHLKKSSLASLARNN